MADAIEAGASSKPSYAGLTANEVFEFALSKDSTRNASAFAALRERQDLNSDSVLSLSELKKGALQKDYQGPATEGLSKLLIDNYAAVAGLSRSRFDSSPLAGVSSDDLDMVGTLVRAAVEKRIGVDNKQDQSKHLGSVLLEGATYGAGAGIMGSALELTAMSMLPARYRIPLVGAAIATPFIAASLGAATNYFRQDQLTHEFTKDQCHRATRLVDAGMLNSTVRAMREYEISRQAGFARLLGSMSFDADLNRNDYIKNDELTLATKLNKGNAEFNKFLTENYADLEMLSRERQANYDRGISYKSFAYFRDEQTRNKLLRDAETDVLSENKEFASENFGRNLLRWSLLGGTIGLGACFLPAKYRAAGFMLASVATVGGIGYSSTRDAAQHEKENAQFLENQRKAIERINRNLTR